MMDGSYAGTSNITDVKKATARRPNVTIDSKNKNKWMQS